MSKPPKPETIAAELTVPERVLLFCLASNTDWVKAGVFKRIFDAASDEPDMEFAMVDATIVKVHRHAQGAKGGPKIRPSANRRVAGPPKSSR